jgi:hypothetical protein
MERYYSTGQRPQRAVAPSEEEEEEGRDFAWLQGIEEQLTSA